MLTVKTIVENTFTTWGKAVSAEVGDNYSMENSATVSKLPYASMYFQGIPTSGSTLEGGEAAVTPSVQIDIYTNGQRALTKAYEIDEVSHAALLSLGYTRSYGPELIQNVDPSIKRLTSRYSRLVGLAETL